MAPLEIITTGLGVFLFAMLIRWMLTTRAKMTALERKYYSTNLHRFDLHTLLWAVLWLLAAITYPNDETSRLFSYFDGSIILAVSSGYTVTLAHIRFIRRTGEEWPYYFRGPSDD